MVPKPALLTPPIFLSGFPFRGSEIRDTSARDKDSKNLATKPGATGGATGNPSRGGSGSNPDVTLESTFSPKTLSAASLRGGSKS